MFHCFRFELEAYPDMSRLPLFVRMKLDLSGIKLSLDQWLAFSREERDALCHLPCDADEERRVFTAYIAHLCRAYRQKSPAALAPAEPRLWRGEAPPCAVLRSSRESGGEISAQEWRGWSDHQRYALYKTASSRNEPEKFLAVLAELRDPGVHG